MIKEIVKDREFLSKPAEAATIEDVEVMQDLRDTLESLEDAVCLAANQIGSLKAIIAYEDGGRIYTMMNPKIKIAAQPYTAQESCLSHDHRDLPGPPGGQSGAPHQALQRLDCRGCAACDRPLRGQARLIGRHVLDCSTAKE